MIDFKILTYDDLDLVKQFVDNPQKRAICANTLANVFIWREYNNTKWALLDNVLILSYGKNNSSDLLCSLHNFTEDNLRRTIEILLEYANSINKRLILTSITKEDSRIIERLFPDKCDNEGLFSSCEYIYNRTDLKLLPGDKYRRKRAEIKKFKERYQYRCVPLNPDLKDEYIKLCNNRHQEQDDSNECFISVETDIYVLNDALDNFERLDLFGISLYVEDKLIAFTFGSKLTDNMVDVMYQKANTEYYGVYSMIYNLWVSGLPQEYEYINAEEDLGIENLRKAKMLYRPCKIENNYRLIIRK